MTPDETRAVDALERRANRAAARMVDEHALGCLGLPYELVVALLAVGWIEGRQDGGEEARDLIRAEMARLTGGLHSVKSPENGSMRDGSICPRCGVHVFPPAHACHVTRANYVVA